MIYVFSDFYRSSLSSTNEVVNNATYFVTSTTGDTRYDVMSTKDSWNHFDVMSVNFNVIIILTILFALLMATTVFMFIFTMGKCKRRNCQRKFEYLLRPTFLNLIKLFCVRANNLLDYSLPKSISK